MRRIKPTHAFKRDLRRMSANTSHAEIGKLLDAVIQLLATDTPLPARCVDHAMRGKMKGYRDCHIRPDLVLIYRKPAPDVLELVRLGSHSELGI